MCHSEPQRETHELVSDPFPESRKGVVLLVDDQPESIDVIRSILGTRFTVKVATHGHVALKIAAQGELDLILLDIVMPHMDGYEVCRRIKSDPLTRDIPIIFLTAMDGTSDETIGLELGAVDYIRKPSNPLVVLARVGNAVALHKAQRDLQRKNIELQTALQLREDMEQMARHDLKGPLSGLIGLPEVLLTGENNLTDEQRAIVHMMEKSAYSMLEMINRSLDLVRIETGNYQLQPETFDLLTVLGRVINDMERHAKPKGVSIHVDRTDDQDSHAPFLVVGEKMLCHPLFSNLILNAIEATPETSVVGITLASSNSARTIRITNPGTVPLSIRNRFFEKYVTSGKKRGTGLGTYSAWLSAKTQGGTIELDCSQPERTAVVVSLPGPA
ncbi:MAG: hybrid sensor histidine kinase/response regulator [Magnetococcales bacterium]|nr:hybrid sensor histidine kinase/response regulator [Magnetococcales bacterium]MBF0322268.1 hybrid sensor histidine kinase/response regulator [Magnetococcales bacterium]